MTSINYVQEVRPDDTQDPSCHCCGAIMEKAAKRETLELIGKLAGSGIDSEDFMLRLGSIQTDNPGWNCKSCGATTGCS